MEKRKFERITVNGRVSGNIVYATDIQIVDLSPGGVLLLGSKKLDPRSECTIHLNYKNKNIVLDGIVVRAHLKETIRINSDIVPVYEIAVEFNELDNKTIESIKNIMSYLTDEWPK